MSKDEAFFTWYEAMIRSIEDAESGEGLSFFHDHRTACKAAWDARSDLIPKMPEDVERKIVHLRYVVSEHAQRLIDSHFGNDAKRPQISTPADPKYDTDLIVSRGIKDAADAIEAQAARIAELEGALEAEREACAKTAESWDAYANPEKSSLIRDCGIRNMLASDIAAAIRNRAALGETHE